MLPHKIYCPLDGTELRMDADNPDVVCEIHGPLVEVSTERNVEFSRTTLTFLIRYELPVVTRVNETVSEKIQSEKIQSDEVAKPSHYNQYTGFEVMDVCRQLVSPDATPASTWFRGNVFKYLARAGWKTGEGKELQDLEKAAEYLRREIERVKTRDRFLDEQTFSQAIEWMAAYKGGGTEKNVLTEQELRDLTAQELRDYVGTADSTPSTENAEKRPHCSTVLVYRDYKNQCPNGHGFVMAVGDDTEWMNTPAGRPLIRHGFPVQQNAPATACGNPGCIEHPKRD